MGINKVNVQNAEKVTILKKAVENGKAQKETTSLFSALNFETENPISDNDFEAFNLFIDKEGNLSLNDKKLKALKLLDVNNDGTFSDVEFNLLKLTHQMGGNSFLLKANIYDIDRNGILNKEEIDSFVKALKEFSHLGYEPKEEKPELIINPKDIIEQTITTDPLGRKVEIIKSNHPNNPNMTIISTRTYDKNNKLLLEQRNINNNKAGYFETMEFYKKGKLISSNITIPFEKNYLIKKQYSFNNGKMNKTESILNISGLDANMINKRYFNPPLKAQIPLLLSKNGLAKLHTYSNENTLTYNQAVKGSFPVAVESLFRNIASITDDHGFYDIVKDNDIVAVYQGKKIDEKGNQYYLIQTKDGYIKKYFNNNKLQKMVQKADREVTIAELKNDKWKILSIDPHSDKIKLNQYLDTVNGKTVDFFETQNITKKFTHIDDNRTEVDFIIKDDNGKEIINSKIETERKSNGNIVKKNINGKKFTFETTVNGDNIQVIKIDPSGIKELITGNLDELIEVNKESPNYKNLYELLKNMDASNIYEILTNDITLNLDISNNKNKGGEIAQNSLTMMLYHTDNNIVNHEIGHIRFDKNNSELSEIYKKELLSINPNDIYLIQYFTDLSYSQGGGLEELSAETNSIQNATDLNSLESALLQQHFPKTIAKILEINYGIKPKNQ